MQGIRVRAPHAANIVHLTCGGSGKQKTVCAENTLSLSFASTTLVRRNCYFPSSNSSLASSEVGRRRRRRRRRGRRRPLPLCLLLLLFSEGCSCLHSPPPLFPCTVVAHKGPRIAFITKKSLICWNILPYMFFPKFIQYVTYFLQKFVSSHHTLMP